MSNKARSRKRKHSIKLGIVYGTLNQLISGGEMIIPRYKTSEVPNTLFGMDRGIINMG